MNGRTLVNLNLSKTRRQLFRDCGIGVGKIALTSLIANSTSGAAATLETQDGLHHHAKAKRVIYLFMAGAPSQLELFDYKPQLERLEGKTLPPSVIDGQRYAFIQPDAAVMAPQFDFKKHGECGSEISNVLPHQRR